MADELNRNGIETPCRWWEDLSRYTPEQELNFLAESDALVYLWAADQESARFEAGMAMALTKPIVAVLQHQPAWFLTLPNVHPVLSDADVLAALQRVRRDNTA